jgi:hypothetical protein
MEPMSSFTRRTKEPRMYWNRAPDILLSLSLSLSQLKEMVKDSKLSTIPESPEPRLKSHSDQLRE